MSRIGKSPIAVPAGVEIKVDNNVVTVKGPKGTLHQLIADDGITVKIEEGQAQVERATNQKRHKAMHGLYRQLINNMVVGVTSGFTKELELHGVGYRASNRGQLLELMLGYSHPIHFLLPDEVKLEAEMKKGDVPRVPY